MHDHTKSVTTKRALGTGRVALGRPTMLDVGCGNGLRRAAPRRGGRRRARGRPVEPACSDYTHVRFAADEGLTKASRSSRRTRRSAAYDVARFRGNVLRGPRRRLRQHPRPRCAPAAALVVVAWHEPPTTIGCRPCATPSPAGRQYAGSPVRAAGPFGLADPAQRPPAGARLRGRRDRTPVDTPFWSGPTSTTRSRFRIPAQVVGAQPGSRQRPRNARARRDPRCPGRQQELSPTEWSTMGSWLIAARRRMG